MSLLTTAYGQKFAVNRLSLSLLVSSFDPANLWVDCQLNCGSPPHTVKITTGN